MRLARWTSAKQIQCIRSCSIESLLGDWLVDSDGPGTIFKRMQLMWMRLKFIFVFHILISSYPVESKGISKLKRQFLYNDDPQMKASNIHNRLMFIKATNVASGLRQRGRMAQVPILPDFHRRLSQWWLNKVSFCSIHSRTVHLSLCAIWRAIIVILLHLDFEICWVNIPMKCTSRLLCAKTKRSNSLPETSSAYFFPKIFIILLLWTQNWGHFPAWKSDRL